MPTNLYGEGDNFDLKNSHVMPALLKKFHEAKINGSSEVVAWGSGKPLREFLHVDDMADGCLFLMKNFNPTKEQNEKGELFFNLGTGSEVSIKELTELIKKVVGFTGEIIWDTKKPDGMPRKLQDMTRMHGLGWRHKIELAEGIKKTYEWYIKSQKSIKS
jgi:GDP-L-fucose synthase